MNKQQIQCRIAVLEIAYDASDYWLEKVNIKAEIKELKAKL